MFLALVFLAGRGEATVLAGAVFLAIFGDIFADFTGLAFPAGADLTDFGFLAGDCGEDDFLTRLPEAALVAGLFLATTLPDPF